MENFKFTMISIIVLVIIGFVGYWAFFTIEPGSVHATKQTQKLLEEKNEELEKEILKLKNEIVILQESQGGPATENPGEFEGITTPSPIPTTPTAPTSTKHQTLVNELQKLIDDNIYMKEKSRGTRVGTIQTFLNIYNNTTKRVDNDYGKGTKTDVINFQKAVGITADGETGPSTYKKMIEWLNKQ